jgi:RNA polymerase sigma-70 factor (ECF subfamily)
MSSSAYSEVEHNYRALYGKLFAVLVQQFGAYHVTEIEDALQNAFLKSLKAWHLNPAPRKRENWLFVVARNDVLNQIKSKNRKREGAQLPPAHAGGTAEKDLRLEVIFMIACAKSISTAAKAVFILKNLFGLNVREISESTLLSQEAVYKAIRRAKSSLQKEFRGQSGRTLVSTPTDEEIATVEHILYAVFSIGFDSFDEKIKSIVNEDLCLESLALAKLLARTHPRATTQNLLALFCFHLARIPAKIQEGQLVSFYQQDQSKWDRKLLSLAFGYLQKPEKLNRFYIEALIAGKHMTATSYDKQHWNEIIRLYELLLAYHHSPVVKLNLSYALHQAGRTAAAMELLATVEKELPQGHFYFLLTKAKLLKATDAAQSGQIMASVLENVKSDCRKAYLMEEAFIAD